MLVLYTPIFKKFSIQKKPYVKGLFSKRMPLYLFNITLLLTISELSCNCMLVIIAIDIDPCQLEVLNIFLPLVKLLIGWTDRPLIKRIGSIRVD